MTHIKTRLSLVEYGSPVDLGRFIASTTGIDRPKANSILIEAGNRVASNLKLNYNPIVVDTKGIRAIDFAGLIRITPSLELEVAPKFLGLNDAYSTWREDFFFLSTLSRHGRLLVSEQLSASGSSSRDLPTLIARAIINMYEAHKRRPLRSYRRVREKEFFIDGDPDPMELLFPSADGFEQEFIRFDQRNSWNADLVAAAKALLPEVNNPSVVNALMRLIGNLSPQNLPSRSKPIPARHRAWRPLHELSMDVLGGLGLSYKQGQARAPGYIVGTWRVWEDLLTIAARLGFGSAAVVPQSGYTLGNKTKITTGTISSLSVYPDLSIESDGIRPKILLDAKYKGHIEKGVLHISHADIYEALAFSKAAGSNHVILAYPSIPNGNIQSVGLCNVFEKIVIDKVNIVGIQVEIRGISRPGAIQTLSRNLVKITTSIINL